MIQHRIPRPSIFSFQRLTPHTRIMAPLPVALSTQVAQALGLSSDQSAFKEGSAIISIPKSDAAFLNPVQEFNRDLSVLAIRAWAERRDEEKRRQSEEKRVRKSQTQNRKNKRRRVSRAETTTTEQTDDRAAEGHVASAPACEDHVTAAPTSTPPIAAADDSNSVATPAPAHRPFSFTIFEALSATGLRSIRYAREIPNLRSVHANDLSATAVEAIWKNVALNFPAGREIQQWAPELDQEHDAQAAQQEFVAEAASTVEAAAAAARDAQSRHHAASGACASDGATRELLHANGDAVANARATAEGAIHPDCKIHVTELDAIEVLYTSRSKDKQYDVIDLDPYGSAAMFIDGAVQAVADGGLLCVTCTDMVVLAGNAYPERAYSLYGGTTTKNDFVHEAALRLVLGLIATTAGRYGRSITPLLSLSIDFYLRVFVSVQNKPVQVKMLASTMGTVQTCPTCGNWETNALGRNKQEEKANLIKYQAGTSHAAGPNCEECGSRFHVAGPMWLGPLHTPSFATEMLDILERAPARFGTAKRIRGMVGVASQELCEPFFFVPPKMASYFHTTNVPLTTVVSSLLNAGYKVSRSHCQPASIKTDARPSVVRDLFRQWVAEKSPINETNVAQNSPARRLLAKACQVTFDLDKNHADTKTVLGLDQASKKNAGVKYQLNPLPNWGPGRAARPESKKDRRRAAAAEAEKTGGGFGKRARASEASASGIARASATRSGDEERTADEDEMYNAR